LHQARLDSLLAALKHLADRGLTAGCVLANFHHRRIVPLMERRLRIFEMVEDADPIALAESRLRRDLFPWEYAATWARRAVDLRSCRNDDASLRAFTMLPVGPLVSGPSRPLVLPIRGASTCLKILLFSLQMVRVNAARSNPPTPRSRAHARAVQRREQVRVARRRERNARWCERREQRSEEFRLREQQGLSSPETEEYSSSSEEEEEEGEEEEDRGQVLPDRWEPAPSSPEPTPVTREPSPGVGVGAPAAGRSTVEAARAAEVPEQGDVKVHSPTGRQRRLCARWRWPPATSAGTSRKRKRAFSSLR
jgi:hypothetical protein